MADATTTTSTGTSAPSFGGRRGGHSRDVSGEHRGRGQSRGRGGPRGGRGRGRGQSRGYGQQQQQQQHQPEGKVPLEMTGRPPGSFGARLTEAATQIQDDLKPSENDAEQEESIADDVEVCFICASPIDHIAIAPCNHQTCHICSLRLRALYKTRACAHCRTESPMVVFTDNPEKKYQDFQDSEFVKIDDNLGIKYEKPEILEDTILLLRYNCPDKTCDVACLGWPDLHRHVKSKHTKVMCDLCTRNKKVFTHEHELFTYSELRRHEKYGDDNPGAVDQSGFKGHPECGFCRQRFYGDDELYTHCREKHERCHICDRRNGGRNPQYYRNYEELEKHFATDHFVCLDAECQANKTNVFESEMDLKAHQLSEHPNGLSKSRDARLVNLSGFDLRTPYQPQRRGGRENRSAGRGRDPNAEPLPLSSAQPLSRAELAYQRQMALQTAAGPTPSARAPTFGGSLTQPSRPTPSQRTQNQAQPEIPSLDTLSLNTTTPTDLSSMTPQERARHLRHTAVSNRAQALLKNDSTKSSQFRTHVSSFRSGTISASDLIDAFFSLFDCPSNDLGKLIRELADLYEDEIKRQALLEAWNNWRSINEDYPSLPGPAGTLPGTDMGLTNVSTGRRVLKLKSSTAQSSRSAVSRQGSWGNALEFPSSPAPQGARAANAQDAFPALSSSIAAHNRNVPGWGPSTRSSAPVQTTASRLANTTNGGNNRTNPISRQPPATMSPRRNEEMFPSLPATSKPNVMMAGFNTRGSAKWGDSGTASPNPWGSGSSTPNSMEPALAEAGDDIGGNKKKGKKGKQTLFHFG